MRKLKIIVFWSVLLSGLLAFLPKHEEKIIWSKDRPLTWEDFKGKPINKSSAGAITCYAITKFLLYSSGVLKINTETCFYPKKSWVQIYDKIPSTLEHEQLHFDIAELYARKFRKQIIETKFKANGKKIKNKFLSIFDRNYKELDNYQDLYDKETTSPRNEVKQKEWLKKIANELAELEAYSNPVIEIKVK